MNTITADIFIQTIFPDDLLRDGERVVIAYPDSFVSRETGQQVDFYRQHHHKDGCFSEPWAAYYFCVSTVRRQRTRQVKKALADVRTAMVLVVDDVGTKSALPPVKPSYSLETSKGNYQWGYLIEPFDVTAQGAPYYDGCLLGLANAGFNDPGFRSATRLARVPGSLHKSGFRARISHWAPGRNWELEGLMDEMGVAPVSLRSRVKVPEAGSCHDLSKSADPLYHWLIDTRRGYGFQPFGDWVYLECPWRHNHTDQLQGATSTVFSPYDYGSFKHRAFKCSHGHCAGLGITHFEEWAQSQGAITTLPEGDRDACDLQLIIPTPKGR